MYNSFPAGEATPTRPRNSDSQHESRLAKARWKKVAFMEAEKDAHGVRPCNFFLFTPLRNEPCFQKILLSRPAGSTSALVVVVASPRDLEGIPRYSSRFPPLPLHCECSDTRRHERFVARKILTADAITGDIHLDESRMSGSADIQAPGHSRIVQLLDHFEHAGPHGIHLCLVLELLGPNLDAFFMEQGKMIPWKVVESLIKQILLGLDYLHRSCKISGQANG